MTTAELSRPLCLTVTRSTFRRARCFVPSPLARACAYFIDRGTAALYSYLRLDLAQER